MKCVDTLLIRPTDTIGHAIRVIDDGDRQIALVIDETDRLSGTVTDGDIRRGMLRSLPLTTPVSEVMKCDPVVATPADTPGQLVTLMRVHTIHQVPIVDTRGRVVDLVVLDELVRVSKTPRPNWVVMMAGGLGNRLRPLTDDIPKPLLKVGDKPILETILDTFRDQDFHRFLISVHYKADMVKSHFGDGHRWNVEIRYLEETTAKGTAGALGLIEERPAEPLVVMNADVLTKVNFGSLLDFHAEQDATATMCVREYNMQVPYGVVRTEDARIVGIDEKPVQRVFINAGIYVLNPGVLDYVGGEESVDMPEVFHRLIDAGQRAAVFPIREYWLDVGQMEDFRRANLDLGNDVP